MSLIWVWLASSAFGADIVVDGTVVAAHGIQNMDRVLVINGGRLVVTPAGMSGSNGTLTLNARTILVDATSVIDGTGAGMQGVSGGAAVGGGAAGVAGGGGSHGGLGSAGTDDTCGVDVAAAGPARGAAPDLVTETGGAGGGASDLMGGANTAGGAGGAAITLDAELIEIHGTILVDGAPGAPGTWGGGGGGAGGGVVIQALTLDCDGEISARGGDGGLGASFGGAGGGGIVEQWWDRDGAACPVDTAGGDGVCGSGSGGIDTAIGDLDWDADGVSTADGDCAPEDAAIKIGVAETCDGKDNDCDGTVDDSGCTGCVAFTADGTSYLDCTAAVTRATAITNCSSKVGGEPGYRLLVVDDAAENAAVAAYLDGANNTNHWLAIDDISAEDTFDWDGPGESWYVNWGANEPNDSSGEDCATLSPGTTVWNDVDCGGTNDYVCELCAYETWYDDDDGDGWGDPADPIEACFGPPAGFVARAGDCDDLDASVNPDAAEACDGVDNDCDGTPDPETVSWFPDADNDGWADGGGVPKVLDCSVPEPAFTASRVGDCDDTSASRSPDDAETCNGLDDDCNGEVDETGCGCDVETFGGSTYHFCDAALSRTAAQSDCDDQPNTNLVEIDDATENNFVTEEADRVNDADWWWIGINDLVTEGTFRWVDGSAPLFTKWEPGQPNNNNGTQDCTVFNDATVDALDASWNDQECTDTGFYVCEVNCEAYDWYADLDSDGWGDLLDTLSACAQPAGYVLNSGDCDDSDTATHPSAGDTPADGDDQDCSGADTCYVDADGDGYGSAALAADTTSGCTGPFEADNADDCNDGDSDVNPGAVEAVGDGDLDCDDAIPCWFDEDRDGAGGALLAYSADGDCNDPYEAIDGDDCDDTDPSVAPGEAEIVGDQIDQDCDGADLCWVDTDGDGFGSGLTVSDPDLDCATGVARTDVPGDCDDAKVAVNPSAVEIAADGVDQNCDTDELCYRDMDLDGQAPVGAATLVSGDLDCADPGEASALTDCDDSNPARFLGAPEAIGDGIDQDCDLVDSCFQDTDLDGFGNAAVTVDDTDLLCENGGPRSSNAGDCADTNAAVNPGAAEIAGDGVDQDCTATELCFTDADGDGSAGRGTAISLDTDCSDPGEFATPTDCDDTKATVEPGAPEVVGDGVDQDCDAVDSCFVDVDLDTWGTSVVVDDTDLLCTNGGPRTNRSGDCADLDATVHPTAVEGVADATDQDCDGSELCYEDLDSDGFGTDETATSADLDCTAPGVSFLDTDCNDASAAINPDAAEIQDSLDNNCDGEIDICFADLDNDGYGDDQNTLACSDPASVADPSDCDDTDAAINVAATEIVGNDVDEDCTDAIACFADTDSDGFGDAADPGQEAPGQVTCDDAAGLWADDADDCDDGDAKITPLTPETPQDGIDQDCDGADGCWLDSDGDAFGDDLTVVSCDDPASTTVPGDCDDTDGAVSPVGTETVGDDRDDDCNGQLDCWTDADSDGFGGMTGVVVTVPGGTCDQPDLLAADDELDCDDASAAISPDAPEISGDGIDNDCDLLVDEDDIDTGPIDTGPIDTDIDTDTDTDTDPGGDLPSTDDRPIPGEDGVEGQGEGCDCDAGAPGAGWIGLLGLVGLIRRRRNA